MIFGISNAIALIGYLCSDRFINMTTAVNSSLAKLNPYSAEGKAMQRLPLESDDSQWVTTIERGEEIDLDILQQQINIFKVSGQKQKSQSEIFICNSGKSTGNSTGYPKTASAATKAVSQSQTTSIHKSTTNRPIFSKPRIKRGFGKLPSARS
jgi:hypothetical protein